MFNNKKSSETKKTRIEKIAEDEQFRIDAGILAYKDGLGDWYVSDDFDCDEITNQMLTRKALVKAGIVECESCGGQFNKEKMKAMKIYVEMPVSTYHTRYEYYCKHCQPVPDEKYIDRNNNHSYYINNKQEVDENCKKLK